MSTLVINFLSLPVPDKNMPYLFLYHHPVSNSVNSAKKKEIPLKQANSVD